ncbi:MAG TPA: SMP-30/gluconolactonase/LRE family protein, partial [Tepidisphaeraceae bacterium]|nr:SMP-30/gluconolactonase/LRE family protein [Tepidisphaeraceae bacterium]
MPIQAEPVLQAKAEHGEGALWYPPSQVLYWVNISQHLLCIYHPSTGLNQIIDVGSDVSTVVPRQKGGVMVTLKNGFASVDLHTRRVQLLVPAEADNPNIRFNDGKCDPAGRFWAGTQAYDGSPGAAKLYCLDTDLSLRCVLDHLTISNGIVWTADAKTMYYIDTPTQVVFAFDYDLSTGQIRNQRPVIRMSKFICRPDGMTLDREGMLWIACWGHGRVGRWNPKTAQLLELVETPAAQLTSSCALGGPNLDEL